MRPTKISQLKTGDRVSILNDSHLKLYFAPTTLAFLKDKIKNRDFIGIREQDGSELFGTIVMMPTGPEVKFDLGQRYKLDLENNFVIGLLEPGDDGNNPPNAPMTQPTQVNKGVEVNMRLFDRNVDGVGTRIAINPNALSTLRGEGIEVMLLGTVRTLEDDNESKVDFNKGQAIEDELYVEEELYIVFDRDEDAKKVRPFNFDRDGVGSRVAVLGSIMPNGNDVTKIYYGTIKEIKRTSANGNFYFGIEFDSKIVGGHNLGGQLDNDFGYFITNFDVLILDAPILDGSITIKADNPYVLQMITDIILSTTSRTTMNRAELIKALIEDKVAEDEVRQSFDGQEAYDLFKDILQDLEKDEAKRLRTTASSVFITPTPAPIVKRPRKKKEPALPEPIQIPTTDTSVFKDEDELSSLLDEFLT